MKSIIETINENKNVLSKLEYVMTYEHFIKWIKSQDKSVSFYSYAQIDGDNPINDLLSDDSQRGIVRFDKDSNEWEVIIDDEGVPANSLTLSKTDIMLLFKK